MFSHIIGSDDYEIKNVMLLQRFYVNIINIVYSQNNIKNFYRKVKLQHLDETEYICKDMSKY